MAVDPAVATPMAKPTIPCSLNGVLNTRSPPGKQRRNISDTVVPEQSPQTLTINER